MWPFGVGIASTAGDRPGLSGRIGVKRNETLPERLSSLRQLCGIDADGGKRDPSTAAELRQYCLQLRIWITHRREELLGGFSEGRAVLGEGTDYTTEVEVAWHHLVRIAAGQPYPPMGQGPFPRAAAAAALDRVVGWCAGQSPPAGASSPADELRRKVEGGRARARKAQEQQDRKSRIEKALYVLPYPVGCEDPATNRPDFWTAEAWTERFLAAASYLREEGLTGVPEQLRADPRCEDGHRTALHFFDLAFRGEREQLQSEVAKLLDDDGLQLAWQYPLLDVCNWLAESALAESRVRDEDWLREVLEYKTGDYSLQVAGINDIIWLIPSPREPDAVATLRGDCASALHALDRPEQPNVIRGLPVHVAVARTLPVFAEAVARWVGREAPRLPEHVCDDDAARQFVLTVLAWCDGETAVPADSNMAPAPDPAARMREAIRRERRIQRTMDASGLRECFHWQAGVDRLLRRWDELLPEEVRPDRRVCSNYADASDAAVAMLRALEAVEARRRQPTEGPKRLSRGSPPRSAAPRRQDMRVLSFIVRCGRLIPKEVERYLASQGDTVADRLALELLQRGCGANEQAVEEILIPLLNMADHSLWDEVQQAMTAIKDAACRSATLAAAVPMTGSSSSPPGSPPANGETGESTVGAERPDAEPAVVSADPNRRQEEAPPKSRRAAQPERLCFDYLTQTVTLDGTPHKIEDPKAFAVYQAIADACPQPVTKAAIQGRVPGCRGEKKVPGLLKSLPTLLQDTVRSGPNGYWLDLSSPPGPRKKTRGKKSRS